MCMHTRVFGSGTWALLGGQVRVFLWLRSLSRCVEVKYESLAQELRRCVEVKCESLAQECCVEVKCESGSDVFDKEAEKMRLSQVDSNFNLLFWASLIV